jgi:hypothetical protein
MATTGDKNRWPRVVEELAWHIYSFQDTRPLVLDNSEHQS